MNKDDKINVILPESSYYGAYYNFIIASIYGISAHISAHIVENTVRYSFMSRKGEITIKQTLILKLTHEIFEGFFSNAMILSEKPFLEAVATIIEPITNEPVKFVFSAFGSYLSENFIGQFLEKLFDIQNIIIDGMLSALGTLTFSSIYDNIHALFGAENKDQAHLMDYCQHQNCQNNNLPAGSTTNIEDLI